MVTAIMGLVVCLINTFMGIYMIVKANKKLGKYSDSN